LVAGGVNTDLMAQVKTSSPILVSNNGAAGGLEGTMVPLADLLSTLEQHFEATFLFKDEVVRRKRVNTDQIQLGVDTGVQLAEILTQLGLTYYQVDEQTYVLLPQTTLLTEDAAQETISGTVTDADTEEPIPGVNILVKGTTTGASTDANGTYELTVESLQDTLVVTYIGYQTQEVPIKGQTDIDIELNPESIMGEEMVVVGYQVQKKATNTGSITSVDGAKVTRTPAVNVENSLVGQLPGLVAVNSSGQPGSSGSTLQIRGSNTLGDNSPLIVIDGITNRTGGLAHLNPNDIEDITVLKDASAAIYGSQAANGVILVTTKRGQEGKPQVSLSYNQGFTQPTRVPEMADATTYARMINEIDLYRSRDPRYSE